MNPIQNSDRGTEANEPEQPTVRREESRIKDMLSGAEDGGIDFLGNDSA